MRSFDSCPEFSIFFSNSTKGIYRWVVFVGCPSVIPHGFRILKKFWILRDSLSVGTQMVKVTINVKPMYCWKMFIYDHLNDFTKLSCSVALFLQNFSQGRRPCCKPNAALDVLL
jgi:hypothetical protein